MATQTSYYNLTKPAGTENVNVGVLNANSDIIDTELHNESVRAAANIANIYDATATYTMGDFCTYLGVLYKCTTNTASPAGAFDSTEWEQVNVTENMADVAESNTFSASGESFTLTSTSEGSVLAHSIYGMSEQDGTPTPSSPVVIKSSVANFTCANSDSTESVTITTDLVLRAIEVTSSDDHNLVRDDKYYIADTVDWSEDDGYVLTKRIEHIELDGTAYCQMLGGGTTNQRFVILYTTTLGYGVVKAGLESKEISDHFTLAASGISHDFGDFKMDTSGNLIIYDKTNTLADTTAFNTWLGTNKPNFMYVLATPTTSPLTAKQAEALLSLKTYDTATSITCTADVSPTMAIEYAKERVPALALSGHNESELKVDWASENVLGGKNLVIQPYTYKGGTIHQVTVTINDDYSISLNGTAGNNFWISLNGVLNSQYTLTLKKGKYRLSCVGFTSGLNENTYLGLIKAGEINAFVSVKGGNDTREFSLTEDTTVFVGIRINSGEVLSHTLYPMLCFASVKNNEYVPFSLPNKVITERIQCNQTTAGTYTLQATVTSNGVVTYEWVSTT